MTRHEDYPQLDRLPAHVRTVIQCGPEDAEVVCVPDCPACLVIFSLERFWDEVGGYPDDALWGDELVPPVSPDTV